MDLCRNTDTQQLNVNPNMEMDYKRKRQEEKKIIKRQRRSRFRRRRRRRQKKNTDLVDYEANKNRFVQRKHCKTEKEKHVTLNNSNGARCSVWDQNTVRED